jgi:hypothetical protein
MGVIDCHHAVTIMGCLWEAKFIYYTILTTSSQGVTCDTMNMGLYSRGQPKPATFIAAEWLV